MCKKFLQSGKTHDSRTHKPADCSLSHVLPQLFSVSFRWTISYSLVLSSRSDAYFLYIQMALWGNQRFLLISFPSTLALFFFPSFFPSFSLLTFIHTPMAVRQMNRKGSIKHLAGLGKSVQEFLSKQGRCQEGGNCYQSLKIWVCIKLHAIVSYTSPSYSTKPQGQILVLWLNMELLQ